MLLKTKCYFAICATIVLLFVNIAQADQPYWLCGPDEDGCPADGYQFCFCIPQDPVHANEPYCLDFNALSCAPLADKPDCNPYLTFKDQASCLATIFHSMPDVPCTPTTRSFCETHKTAICDKSGKLDTCRYNL